MRIIRACAELGIESAIWGKALTLIILYSIYLGVSSYIFAANSELSLIPPKEMIYLTLSGAINVSLFVALIIGADSFSGERERATLEALLLTPAKRRQIVIGKFLASVSPWPIAMLIAIPYTVVLSQNDPILGTALFWGAVLGGLLSPAFTGFAMIVSLWSASNRTSLFASLTVYILFYLPVQFPGSAQTGTFGRLLKKLNPLEGADHFLEKIIDSLAAKGTMLGSAGVMVMDASTCMVAAMARIAHFYHHESCGRCTPCREGCGWLERVLHRIESRHGLPQDLDLLLSVSRNITGNTTYALGDAAAMPCMSFVEKFRDEFRHHIDHKSCLAGTSALQGVC